MKIAYSLIFLSLTLFKNNANGIEITSNNTAAISIPENGAATGNVALAFINVQDDCIIQDVDVIVRVSHLWVGDLTFTLACPDGNVVGLMERPGLSGTGCCGDSSNLIAANPITFDDSAVVDPESLGSGLDGNTAIPATSVYSAGGFLGPPFPAGSLKLTDLNGLSSAGTWIFTAADSALGQTGTVSSVTLRLTLGLTCSTPSPTPEPTPSPTPSPTPEPTPAPTPSPTPEPTPSPTPSPTSEPTPAPTLQQCVKEGQECSEGGNDGDGFDCMCECY